MKERIKSKLSEDTIQDPQSPRYGWDSLTYRELEMPARIVIAAYQNANRWLDTLKEQILIDFECPHFSNIVHELAHTMPKRFDKFGDILHTANLTVPYPETAEWTEYVNDIPRCIELIFQFLDDITSALASFRKSSEERGLYAFAVACDELILDISKEYEFFIRAEGLYNLKENDLVNWDSCVYQYHCRRDNLI